MPHYIPRAPHGVTCIRLDNGDEALYVNGELISTCYASEPHPRIIASGVNLSAVLSLPFQQINTKVPDVPEWTWENVITSLGWGERIELTNRVIRSVLECSLSHITRRDSDILSELCHTEYESEWIHESDLGYIIRVDAISYPLLVLKRHGISKAARMLIYTAMIKADISMVHFTSWGEMLADVPTFNW
ncbi:TPA: hypothetical protein H2W97_004046 [Salmonella enterica]|uniref:DUF5983 family protein n=1 Tax=Enterobacter roggenkampii TaxID=1812935 RepID=UPI0019CB4CC5|nr:hypothetical protein [Salmonella enterica subsp. enterica serovar Orion]HAK7474977.1 hypothetical protein [Salmonella enterica]EJR7832868.1 hypothetical protein [Salmonella enterica subsp. enterica serovar Orion]HAK8236152.1 hypothetical protein [Salmonella enterica]HAK8531561.1 hypothetical protein [Salmonella enterica]